MIRPPTGMSTFSFLVTKVRPRFRRAHMAVMGSKSDRWFPTSKKPPAGSFSAPTSSEFSTFNTTRGHLAHWAALKQPTRKGRSSPVFDRVPSG